jgi:hypothetical protein
LAVLCFLALAACLSDWKGDEGTFNISVGGGNSRAVDWPMNDEQFAALEHTITVSGGPGGPHKATKVLAGQTVPFSVSPGYWDISIEAYLDEELVAVGSALRKEIKPGQNGTIIITMKKQSPSADDFIISGLEQTYDGEPKTVSIEPKPEITAEVITIWYEGTDGTLYEKSADAPSAAGVYAVTFDTATAEGLSAGTLTINKAEGAEVDASALTDITVTYNSITIDAVIVSSGQTVEYAYNTNNSVPETGWQTDTTFIGLSADTTYYIFARARESDNYNAGAVSGSLVVTTPQSTSQDSFVYYWVDPNGILVTSSEIETSVGGTVTITAQAAGYNVVNWYVNSFDYGHSGNTYEFSRTTPGRYVVSLFVEREGMLYNTDITIVVVQ